MPEPIAIPGRYQQAVLELMAGNCVRLSDSPLVVRCAVLLEAAYRLREMIDLSSLEAATADLRKTGTYPLTFPQNFDPTPRPKKTKAVPKEEQSDAQV